MPSLQRKGFLSQERTDFEAFVALLFISKGTIFYCTVLTVAVAVILSVTSPRQYEATAKILAEPQKEDNPYSLEARSQQERHMFLETQKELVVSQSVLQGALASLLDKDPQAVQSDEVEQFQGRISVKSRAGMGKNPFSGNGIGESNTFFISARGGAPQDAQRTVNAIVSNYLKAVSRIRAEQARSAMEILDSAVAETKQRTQEAHKRLAEFEARTGSLLHELMNIDKPTVRVYPELQELRATYEAQRSEIARTRSILRSLETTLADDGTSEPIVPPEIITKNPSITVLKTKIADLRLKMSELSPFFTESSREVGSLQVEIRSAEQALRNEVAQALEGEREGLTALEQGLAERQKTLDDYEQKLSSLSLLNSQHAELKREYEGSARALDSQLESLAVARIASAERTAKAANIAVVDWGVPNLHPISPRTFRNLVLSGFLGLGIGILLVVFRQLAFPIFVHPRQVERVTDIPVVATLSTISPGERAHDIWTTKI